MNDRAEEKNQRHHQAEEKERAVAHREPDAHLRERPGMSQAFAPVSPLALIPQAAAGNSMKHIFKRRRKHFQALQFVIFRFELLHQRDNRLRRPRRMQHVGAVEFAAVGDAFERASVAVASGRARRTSIRVVPGGGCFSSRGVPMRDHPSVIDDGDAVAEAFGLFDIVRGEQDRLLARASAPR